MFSEILKIQNYYFYSLPLFGHLLFVGVHMYLVMYSSNNYASTQLRTQLFLCVQMHTAVMLCYLHYSLAKLTKLISTMNISLITAN